MTSELHTGHLGAVYDAGTTEEVAALYDGWAATYDADMSRAGYRHPAVGLALLARYAPRGAGPVLDAGCGTGLLGDWLGILGFTPVVGLDFSKGMLAVARSRSSYAQLHHLALGASLPFADGEFASVIATGVFTTGHVGVEGLPEIVRITRPGGVIVLTVKTTLWDRGFGAVISGDPNLRIEERTEPYVSMPGEAGTIPSLAVAVRRR
jgi:SAM-dependent methyltransferase